MHAATGNLRCDDYRGFSSPKVTRNADTVESTHGRGNLLTDSGAICAAFYIRPAVL